MIGPINEIRQRLHEERTAAFVERFARFDTDDKGILTDDDIETLVGNIQETGGLSLDLEAFTAALGNDRNGEIAAGGFEFFQRPDPVPRPPKRPRRFRGPAEGLHPQERIYFKRGPDDI